MTDLKLDYQESATHTHALLKNLGHPPVVPPAILHAALQLLEPGSKSKLVRETAAFFRDKAILVPDGLATLPAAWLRQLPAILLASRKPHWDCIPYMLRRLEVQEGVLCLSFAQEQANETGRVTACDQLRIATNLALRPHLWTPLPAGVEKQVWDARPDLRSVLMS